MTSVIVLGAINIDLVVVATRLPGPGDTVVGPRVTRHGGGKGANAAVAAARTGAEVWMLGAVGSDDTGAEALAELAREGIHTDQVAVLADQATGVALIVVDPAGENQIAVGAGANAAVDPTLVRDVVHRLGPAARCLLVSTEISGPAALAAIEAASGLGLRTVLNPAPVIDEVLAMLAFGPILTPNRNELGQLAVALQLPTDVHGAARALASHTGAPVVVTLGGDGVLVATADGQLEAVPAPPANVIDTTGAGDTFNGAFCARLAAGDDLRMSVDLATAAASRSVELLGARGSG